MVGGNGEAGRLAQPQDHVEVGESRLDEENIGALKLIELRLNVRLASIRRILLVGLLVSKARVGVERVTEGAVVRGGVLGGVREDGDIGEALGVESVADGADAPVHHVGGRHDVRARARLADDLLAQLLDGVVVEDLAVLDDAVVAHARVGVERNVRAHDRLRESLLEHTDRRRHNPGRVVGFLSTVRLEFVLNFGEEDEGLDAVLPRVLGLGHHGFERVALAPGHRRDLRILLLVMDEERVDKVRRAEHSLLDHLAHRGALAVAARARALLNPRTTKLVLREDALRHLRDG